MHLHITVGYTLTHPCVKQQPCINICYRLSYCRDIIIHLLQGYIVEDLKNKMKYLRNSKPNRALSTKRDVQEKEEPDPKKKRVDPKQFPHAPEVPEMLVGEDMESCERHIKFMQKEEKKKTANRAIISNLMERTFPYRRKEIVEKPTALANIIKRYPSLRRHKQVKCCAHHHMGIIL